MDHAVFYSEPMVLRFDSYENRIAKGKLQTVCYRTPFQFDSMDHLFMIMDDVLDSIHFPRREGDLRHLDLCGKETELPGEKREEKTEGFGWKSGDRENAFERIDEEQITEYVGNEWKNTGISGFHGQMTITVNRREHSSMQGTLVMNGERANFRSALELMHMFHEYLDKRFALGR